METTPTPSNVYANKGIYSRVTGEDYYSWSCGKCGGRGGIPEYGFNAGGVCFDCNGQGTLTGISESRVRGIWQGQQLREAAKERKRLAICAERDARVARLAAQAPEVATYLQAAYDSYQADAFAPKNGFIVQLAEQIHNAKGRDLSPKQLDAARNVMARDMERKAVDATRSPVPEGRITVTGTVLSTKVVDGQYGTGYKMLVESEQGFKVYGSIPSSMLEQYTLEEFNGSKVTFTAQVEASEDDKSFGFFKRPTKGTVN